MLQQYLEIVSDFQKWAKEQKRPIHCSTPFRKTSERFLPKRKPSPPQKTAPQAHTTKQQSPIQQTPQIQKQPPQTQPTPHKPVEIKKPAIQPPPPPTPQELKKIFSGLPENIQRLIPQPFKSTKPLIGLELKDACAKLFPYITIETPSWQNSPPSYLTQLPRILFLAFVTKEHPQSSYLEKLHQAVDTKLQKATLTFTPKAEDAARTIILDTIGTLSCIVLAYSPETLPEKDQFLTFLGIESSMPSPTQSPLVHVGNLHHTRIFTLELNPRVEEVQTKKDLWAYLGGLLQ